MQKINILVETLKTYSKRAKTKVDMTNLGIWGAGTRD